MKKSILAVVLLIAMAGTISTSYANMLDNKLVIASVNIQDAKKDKGSAKHDLKENQKDFGSSLKIFKKESESKIKIIDDGIGDLKFKFYKSKIKDKESYQNNLNQLEERNDLMKKKLTDNKINGQNELNSFKLEFDHELAEIAKAVKNFNTNLKK